MNRLEFEAAYAARSGVTIEWLHRYGRYGYPCNCGGRLCAGWQMLSIETARDMVTLGRLPERTLIPPV